MTKKLIIWTLVAGMALGTPLTGCSSRRSSSRITVVKPKKRIFAYNPRWHKNSKRTKKVTYRLQ